MQLLDSTLREGEQTPGVSFTVEEKLRIARLLDEFGIDIIEVGHPAVSRDVKEACRVISREGLQAGTMAHSRALKKDIEQASEVGVDWIGIFLGTSQISLDYKLHVKRTKALAMIYESVSLAKKLGLKVRFTPEDATRTDFDYLKQAIQSAEEAGADRISIADTVGTATPSSYGSLIKEVVGWTNLPVHVHCHNDYGMAVANSLTGFESGASLIDVTVNGLGERTGIASLAPVVVALTRLFDIKKEWKLNMLLDISHEVERMSNLLNSETEPIVGKYAFSHKAGLHTKAVLENPKTYEAIPPDIVHKHRELVIDKYTGKEVICNRLNQMGIKPGEEDLTRIVKLVKEAAGDGKLRFTDVDLLEIWAIF